jgi:hypothetical protein
MRVLKNTGFEQADFLDVDIFLWLLFNELGPKKEIKPIPEVVSQEKVESEKPLLIRANQLEHWDVMAILLKLGNLLGYETYTADPSKKSSLFTKSLKELAVLEKLPQFTAETKLDTVRLVDVIWFKEEFPGYCFEVEHSTDVTKGLLRLYQIRQFTDAKFYILGPSHVKAKFETELSKDPFQKYRHRYTFKSYEDLIGVFEKAQEYFHISDEFLGNKPKE